MWCQQLAFNEMEHAADAAAKRSGVAAGKGTSHEGGRRHWSNTLLHNSYFHPYPFDLDLTQVGAVAFICDEYCTKCGAPNKSVGDLKKCIHGSKPAPPVADTEAEVKMDAAWRDWTTPPPAKGHESFAKSAPMPPLQGMGKAAGNKGAKGRSDELRVPWCTDLLLTLYACSFSGNCNCTAVV